MGNTKAHLLRGWRDSLPGSSQSHERSPLWGLATGRDGKELDVSSVLWGGRAPVLGLQACSIARHRKETLSAVKFVLENCPGELKRGGGGRRLNG